MLSQCLRDLDDNAVDVVVVAEEFLNDCARNAKSLSDLEVVVEQDNNNGVVIGAANRAEVASSTSAPELPDALDFDPLPSSVRTSQFFWLNGARWSP
jgi:hypothetical protein